MSLQSILEIFTELLTDEERNWFPFGNEVYKCCGSPSERQQIAQALETMMAESIRRKKRYPRIIFKRLKQLQKGEWAPAVQLQPRPEPQMNPAAVERYWERRRKRVAG
jgi:hypothetical protein